jgi:hypothetical protein
MTGFTLTTLLFVVLTGSPSFRVREAASKGLCRMSEACPQVVLNGERSQDPEVRERCRQVMNRWYMRHAAKLVDAMEPAVGWPWCDSLGGPFRDEDGWEMEICMDRSAWNLEDRKRFLTLAQKEGYPPGHAWNAYREATRRWLVELVAQRKDAAYFLRCLVEGHLQQCRHYGYPPRYGLFESIAAPKGD